MMTNTHPLATAWLDRVAELSIGMPEDRRRELLADLREHLDVALTDRNDAAAVDRVLARMGDPADVVAAARDDLPPPAPPPAPGDHGPGSPGPAHPADRLTRAEVVSLTLLVLSGLLLILWPLAVVAWVVAVTLLVTRTRWEGLENLVALLLPFGFAIPYLALNLVAVEAAECVTTTMMDAAGNVSEMVECGGNGGGIVGIAVTIAIVAVFLAAVWGVVWLVRRIRRRYATA